jgi:hypothetical protein
MLQLTNALEGSGLGYSCELDAVPFSVYRAVRDEFSGDKLSLASHLSLIEQEDLHCQIEII